jgi:Bacterial transcriptional regulator
VRKAGSQALRLEIWKIATAPCESSDEPLQLASFEAPWEGGVDDHRVELAVDVAAQALAQDLGAGARMPASPCAAPVLDRDGDPVAAVGIPVPASAYSVEELRKKLGPPVVAAAKGIAAALRAG